MNENLGLRERKKLKTRATLQQHAMELFISQGYESTTINQICEAADVSPSTFFRYFPTKEDVAMYDVLDPFVISALHRQPESLSPIAALRAAMHEAFAELPQDELQRQMQRFDLIRGVPELQDRMLSELVRTMEMTVDLFAGRTHLPRDDPRLRSLSGALIGVVMAALLGPGGKSPAGMLERLDEALGHLEQGLPLA